jgi:hypothetical protein
MENDGEYCWRMKLATSLGAFKNLWVFTFTYAIDIRGVVYKYRNSSDILASFRFQEEVGLCISIITLN